MGARFLGRKARNRWDRLPISKRKEIKAKLRGGRDGGLNNLHVAGISAVVASGLRYVSHLEESPVTHRSRYMAVNAGDYCGQAGC